MEPTQNIGVSVSPAERGSPPSVTTLQHRPGSRDPRGWRRRKKALRAARLGGEPAGWGGGSEADWRAELPRPPGFVQSPGLGTVWSRGKGSAAMDRSRHPATSAPTSGGREMPGRAVPSATTTKPGQAGTVPEAADCTARDRASGGKVGRPSGSHRGVPWDGSPRRGSHSRRWVRNGLRFGQASIPPSSHPSAPAPPHPAASEPRAAAGPAPQPCPPADSASHHRSSSRLSFCRLPDCTPWAPRPPPPLGSCCCCCRRGSAGREKGWGSGGGGRLAGKSRPKAGEEGAPEGLGTAGRRGRERGAGGGSGANSRHWGGGGSRQTTSGGRGEMGPVHCGLHGGGRGTTIDRVPSVLRQGPSNENQFGECGGKYSLKI